MELTPEIVKRLSYIKYYYEFAREQSKLPSPQNYISILMFHDSIELFLYLSAQFRDIKIKTNINFMDYWQRFVDDGFKLSRKADMNKLNEARKGFKHTGNFPNKDDIEFFRVITKSFFEENCPIIFGIEFNKISLIDLIQDDEVREILENAQNFYVNNKYKEALAHIGIAFYVLLENYKKSTSSHGRSPFDIGENLIFYGIDWDTNNRNLNLNDLFSTVKAIQKILEPIVLNLDYRRYFKFWFLTPIYILTGKEYYDKYNIHWTTERDKNDFKKEDVEYCMNFIIESGLKLQEFDLEIDDGRFLSSFFR